MATTDLPAYLVELNISGASNGWVLGVSALGSGTILRSGPVTGAALTTVTGFVSASIARGRADELGQMQAATATVTLDNADGRFSPDNLSSPYYPNMVPQRQIRISARVNASSGWKPLMYGYVDTIQPVDNGPVDGNVVIGTSDWLSRAAGAQLNLSRPQETDVARFAALVAAIGSDSLPVVVVGPPNDTETLLAKTYVEQDGLSALTEITDVTRGVIYQGRDGIITYRTRYGKWSVPGAFSTQYVFDQIGLNPVPSVVSYESLDYDLTTQYLNNEIRINPSGTADGVQVASDATSQTTYGRKTLQLDLATISSGRASGLATTLLQAYKDPYPRIHTIKLSPAALSGAGLPVWDDMLALDLGDTVRIIKRQPGSVAIDRTMFVEGIAHDITAATDHAMTLQLSDRRQSTPAPWILGTSQLGINANLAW